MPATGTAFIFPPSEYDSFADIYSVWTATAASTRGQPAVLSGRVRAAEGRSSNLASAMAASRCRPRRAAATIIGVDLSPAMLDRCRRRAEDAGVLDRLTLIRADFRGFELDGARRR